MARRLALLLLSGCALFHDYSGKVIAYQDDPRCQSSKRREAKNIYHMVVEEARRLGYMKDTKAPSMHDVCVSTEEYIYCDHLEKKLYGCVYWNGWVVLAGGGSTDWRKTMVHESINWLGPMTQVLRDWPKTEKESVASERYLRLREDAIERLGVSK